MRSPWGRRRPTPADEVYRYFAVPAAVRAALMDASSKGVFFNQHVRAKYPFARV
jgi:hypothetical protein